MPSPGSATHDPEMHWAEHAQPRRRYLQTLLSLQHARQISLLLFHFPFSNFSSELDLARSRKVRGLFFLEQQIGIAAVGLVILSPCNAHRHAHDAPCKKRSNQQGRNR